MNAEASGNEGYRLGLVAKTIEPDEGDGVANGGRAHAEGDAAIDLKLTLSLLDAVQEGGDHSQRNLASRLGIALGLANTYVKRCVSKGLIKIRSAPAKRFAYYLTPQGFAEKARLTADYLTFSLSLFRQARDQFSALFADAGQRGQRRILLLGIGDLAEIAVLAAIDSPVQLVGVVAPGRNSLTYAGLPILQSLGHAPADSFDAVLITSTDNAQAQFDAAVAAFGSERVLAPKLLGLRDASTVGEVEEGDAPANRATPPRSVRQQAIPQR